MGLAAAAANYLFVGPELVTKLEPLGLPVDLIETADQLMERDQRATVLGVMWAGDQVGDDGRGGASQLINQRWLVLLMLNNAGAAPAARSGKAGPLLSQVHQALAGYAVPGAGNRKLARATASLTPQLTATRALFPLGFQITLAL